QQERLDRRLGRRLAPLDQAETDDPDDHHDRGDLPDHGSRQSGHHGSPGFPVPFTGPPGPGIPRRPRRRRGGYGARSALGGVRSAATRARRHPPPRYLRRRKARSTSLAASFSARSWRLSYVRLPRASASSTLARPSLKYSDSGTSVEPRSRVAVSSRSISLRCSSSLRVRRGSWLVHVPSVYSGMCTPCSHSSPSVNWPNPSVSEARPARSDFTSVPVSTSPASTTSSMW